MDRGSQLDEDDEDDKEDEDEAGGGRRRQAGAGRRTQDAGRRTQEATNIKSNNPHLAGGKLYPKNIYVYIHIIYICIS